MVVTVLLGACTNDDRTVTLPEEPTQHSATYFDIPAAVQIQYDILVVVDNSPAMAGHAERAIPQVAEMFGGMAQRRGDPDWHLAVITSDLGGASCSERGDDALFMNAGLVGSPFLIEWRHIDDRHTANYEGTLEDAFARLATVGSSGCPNQQPLAAVRRALEEPRNAGFRRDGANLLVMIVNGSDDGSAGPIEDHIAYLKGTALPYQVFVAGIYDKPATRLDAFVAAFQDRSVVSPLRADDVTADLYLPISGGGQWGAPCLEGRLGPVPECSISDVLVKNGNQETERVVHEAVISACATNPAARPCWTLKKDLQNCPTWNDSDNLVLEIVRRDYPPMGTHVRGNCVTR